MQIFSKDFNRPLRSDYYLVFLLLLISVSWIADIGSNAIQYPLIVALFAVLISRKSIRYSRGFLQKFAVLFVATLSVIVLQDGIFSRSNQLVLINMLLALMVSGVFRDRGKAFLISFLQILYFSTIISVVLLPLLYLSDLLVVQVPSSLLERTEFKEGRELYSLLGLSYFVSSTGPQDVWRNQAFFWEPGVFAVMLTFALMSSIVLGQSMRHKILYIAGIISTFAIGGWAVLGVLFGVVGFRNLTHSRTLYFVLVSALILLVYLNLNFIRGAVVFLFDRDIESDASVYIRSTDLWLPFVVAFESPFWGQASVDSYIKAMRLTIDREMDGITNSLGSYFYRFGIPWGLYFCYIIGLSLKMYSPRMVFGFPVVLCILMYEPIGFSLFFFCFVLVGLNNSRPVDLKRVTKIPKPMENMTKLSDDDSATSVTSI